VIHAAHSERLAKGSNGLRERGVTAFKSRCHKIPQLYRSVWWTFGQFSRCVVDLLIPIIFGVVLAEKSKKWLKIFPCRSLRYGCLSELFPCEILSDNLNLGRSSPGSWVEEPRASANCSRQFNRVGDLALAAATPIPPRSGTVRFRHILIGVGIYLSRVLIPYQQLICRDDRKHHLGPPGSPGLGAASGLLMYFGQFPVTADRGYVGVRVGLPQL
jgi:hypothetical protein